MAYGQNAPICDPLISSYFPQGHFFLLLSKSKMFKRDPGGEGRYV